jgi:hypothetical protein
LVFWNGVQIADLPGPTNGWVLYSYSGLSASRDAVTRVEFQGEFGSPLNGLDDVAVDQELPEPASIELLAGGAALPLCAGLKRPAAGPTGTGGE